MTDRRAYWLWLQNCLGCGSHKPFRIRSVFDSVQAFYEGGERAFREFGFFTPKEMNSLLRGKLGEAQALLEYAHKLGQQVITPDDDEYPERLKNIANPPCALFVKGQLPKVDEEACIAVVGTRKSTQTGSEIAFDFCMDMARVGAVIVSGGALGIDTAAHKGALQGGGKTVAVLGCGINYNYLMENASLRAVISQNGALVSEYPPDTPSAASNFPIRNRIISGLSLGTLVVEAAEKSGSLITADLALEQGRDVFAVPGSLKNPVSAGTNNLIKAGAKAVSSAFDILEEYCFLFPQKLHFPEETKDNSKETYPVHTQKVISPEHEKQQKDYTKKTNEDSMLSEDAKKLFTSLTAQPRTLPELSEQTGIPVQRLLTAVTELELSGRIAAKSGRRYSLPE